MMQFASNLKCTKMLSLKINKPSHLRNFTLSIFPKGALETEKNYGV